MNKHNFVRLVGVRRHNLSACDQNRYCVCCVPDFNTVDRGTLVLFGAPGSKEYEKGVCISDTLLVDNAVADLIYTIANQPTEQSVPEIKAVISIEWLNNNDCNKKEGCQ